MRQGAHWQSQLESQLTGRHVPRVVSTALLIRLAESIRPVSRRTVSRWIDDAIAVSRLTPVAKGLYLNRMALPPVCADEAVQHLFPGAVVSLQRVLGQVGVLNNPSRILTAIRPIPSSGSPPQVGRFEFALGEIHLRAIPERLLNAGRMEDRLQAGRTFPVATPEKALVDWLYLGNSPRSTLPPLPDDIDLDDLDVSRLERLAKAAGVTPLWHALRERQNRVPDYDEIKVGF